MKSIPKIILFFLLALQFCQSVYARTAQVSFLQGSVLKVKEGKEFKLTQGQEIQSGEIIKTQADATVILTLDDQSQVKLNQNSELSLGSELKTTEVHLKAGSAFAKVLRVNPLKRFYIKTKTAVMGVRGTQFFAAYGKQTGDSSQDLWMCVKEGEVEIESVKNLTKVLVKEGQGVLVEKGSEISPPKAYSWTNSLNWNLDPASGSVDDRGSINSAYKNLLEQDYD